MAQQVIQNVWEILLPFKEATRLVGISNIIPLVLQLEHTLNGAINRALETQQQEEKEDLLLSQGQQDSLNTASIPVKQRQQVAEGKNTEESWGAGSE